MDKGQAFKRLRFRSGLENPHEPHSRVIWIWKKFFRIGSMALILQDALAYAFVIAVVAAFLAWARNAFPARKPNEAVLKKFGGKSKLAFWVDAAAIPTVFVLCAVYYLALVAVKTAFFFAIVAAGAVMRFAASAAFGKGFWEFYSSVHAGFDTMKAYLLVSVVLLLLCIPFLFDGLLHRVSITDSGVDYYDSFSFSTRHYSWNEFASLEARGLGTPEGYFIIRFNDGKRIDTQNEAWDAAEEESAAGFVSLKTGLPLKPAG